LCIGQKQRWYLLRMLGDESRLRFDATSEPEFDAGRWVDYWSPVREVIYFKRAVYAQALQELGEQAFAAGPPPRPEWWTEELLHAPGPLPPRRRGARRPRPQAAVSSTDTATTANDSLSSDSPRAAEARVK
jgi:hypothetical protein